MSMYSPETLPASGSGIEGAKQSMKDECDINLILKRHKEGAGSTHVNANQGRFADVTAMGDYRTVIERVRSAEKFFMGLSAEQRAAFDNEAAAFLDAVEDPDQVDLLEELGLLPLIEAVEPLPEAPVDPPDPPAPPEPE